MQNEILNSIPFILARIHSCTVDIYCKGRDRQNYSAPKFTKNLQKSGECIAERTFSKYMKVLPLIVHSNRGSQYVSQAYRDATDNIQRNYSRTSYPTTPL